VHQPIPQSAASKPENPRAKQVDEFPELLQKRN
jgi:hypothetical protein